MKMALSIEMPSELLQEFLQAIRDFDTKHDPNHEDKIVVTMLSQSDHTVDQITSIFKSIKPEMPECQVFMKEDNHAM